jgi:hypothetical protein
MPDAPETISDNPHFPEALRRAVTEKCTMSARRREPVWGARRPFLSVRELGHRPARRRLSTRPRTFPFSLPRRQQLALLDFPVLRRELARRRRLFLTELGIAIMGAGFSLNAAARLLRVSSARLCVWRQAYRSAGPSGLRSKSQADRSCKQAPCKISFWLAL